MEQNVEQPEFLALGFSGEPLGSMVQKSFEKQDQGLENSHGFEMISPYIDPSGARLIRLMRNGSASVSVSLIHPGVAAARVGLINPTVALVDIYDPKGQIAGRVTCAADDFFTYPTLDSPPTRP